MKRIYLLLLIFLFGGVTAEAQYSYSLQVKTNTGGNISGNTYLTATGSGTRTRTDTKSWWQNRWTEGEWGEWSDISNAPTLSFGNRGTNTIVEGAVSYSSETNTSRIATQSATYIGAEWTFEAVEYRTGVDGKVYGQPGWYHIRNTGLGLGDYCLAVGEDGTPTLTDDPSSDGAMWRLIKVPVSDKNTEDIMYFKLVSKSGATVEAGGGTLLYHNGVSTTTTVSAAANYGQANSVFLLTSTEESIVKNDDQEIVSNEVAANAENVWDKLPPTPTINDIWNQEKGDLSKEMVGFNYTLVPIGYGGSAEAKVVYGHYAAGNTDGDGYYFTRLPKSESFYQNLNEFDADKNTVIRFSVWMRAITDGTLQETSTTPGLYSVGKVTLTFKDASTGNTEEKFLELTVPDWAITTHEDPNYPDAWYYYAYTINYQPETVGDISHGGKSIIQVKVENTMQTAEGEKTPLLDVDNIVIKARSLIPQATFIYKHSKQPIQSRQNVHELHHNIYTVDGATERLITSTKNFAYYRWYKITTAGQELAPDLDLFAPVLNTGSTEATMTNGVMYFNANKSGIDRGSQVDYDIPDDFYSDDATIYCDLSNYSDFTWTGDVSDNSGEMIEPSLSVRNVFHILPASEMADAIDDALSKGTTYEVYELEAPVGTADGGTRLRLTPQYKAGTFTGDYWIKSGKELYRAGEFRWYKVDKIDDVNNTTQPLTGGIYSFPGTTNNNKYLQINTSSKTAGGTEYYAVDAYYSGGGVTVQKRVAIFQVTYKAKSAVGPKLIDPAKAADDLFAHLPDKKLIISKTFDQMGEEQSPLPEPFPPANIRGEYSLYGMGVQRLAPDESTYGFTNPLHYSSSGTGTHLHHRPPYWSEYGFPQQINGVTESDSWSTTATVSDITYLKAGGGTAKMGNMLYVDASEQPGIFATLNFNESFCAGAKLYFSAWVVNLNNSSSTSADNGATNVATRPNLVFVLKTIGDDGTETIVKRFYTGDIGYGNVNKWFQIGFDFVIPPELIPEEKKGGEQAIDFRLEIQNNGLSTTGNDFALDDICVYRTNPAISAVRTNDVFCLPDGGGVEITEPLTMSVEVNLSQLWPGGDTAIRDSLFFRFIDAAGTTFPGKQKPQNGDDMYINMGYYDKEYKYHYGVIPINVFNTDSIAGKTDYGNNKFNIKVCRDPAHPEYNGMYLYRYGSTTGDYMLVFSQLIPTSVLNDGSGSAGDFNTGIYSIYVGESTASILSPKCAGAAAFKIQFDATDFEMTVGGTSLEETGDLAICTNNDVNVKAYATEPNTEEKMFAYYDWYLGPLNTQPNITAHKDTTYNAREFTYTLEGQYKDANSMDTLLFRTIENAIIRNEDGFETWLATKEGQAWQLDENFNGPAWVWGTPNYVGFNQYGGYFRYIIPNVSETRAEIEPVALDAVTSATRIGARDNKNTWNTTEKKPVDFRTLKQDISAYRFFYPYEDELPSANQKAFPVDYRTLSTDPNNHYWEYIDFKTGKYYTDIEHKIPVNAETATRFTADSYKDNSADHHVVYYMTDYNGNFIKADGTPIANDSEKVPYIKDLDDLNKLLARMFYWEHRGYVLLYKDQTDISITSLAANYLTVVPSNVAFLVDNLNELTDEEMKDFVHICTTPTQIALQAESWSPDSWFGQVMPSGQPDMPYFDIDSDEYIFTVRLPERKKVDGKEIRPTEQFVLPMLYFDEIRNALVRLTDVLNEEGESVIGEMKGRAIAEAYIGLIDPVYTDKLARDVKVPITREYDPEAEEGYRDISPADMMDVRWKLATERGPRFALESYPMVHNGYNYFFEDPVVNEVSQEGDPLPIDSMIGDFRITNNKIGIEILANDAVLRNFVSVEGTGENAQYHFKPGYTYDFVLEATGADDWALEGSDCDLSVDYRLKVVPDTVIWGANWDDEATGGKSDWNRDGNWYIPVKKDGIYTETASEVKTFPPLPQTKVIIPAGKSTYAALEEYENLVDSLHVTQGDSEATGYDTSKKIISMEVEALLFEPEMYIQKDLVDIHATPFIEFDYNYVPNACDTIHFKAGSELGRVDQLIYNYAKVDLKLPTNRWFGLSAPLRDMYSGDFMFERQNPLTEMRLHDTSSPQTGAVYADWTQPFHNVNERLEAGTGFSARIGKIYYTNDAFYANPDLGISNYSKTTDMDSMTYFFPDNRMSFHFYDEISKALHQKNYQTIPNKGRDYGHRFAFEATQDENALVTIPIEATDTVKLVGNPFMSHIDFEEFYRVNAAVITPEYRILSGGNQYIALSGEENTVKDDEDNDVYAGLDVVATTDPDKNLTWKSIPPMQSFIVKIRQKAGEEGETVAAGNQLLITGAMSVTDPAGSRLRSASGESSPYPLLTIEASTVDHRSQAVVVLSEKAGKAYHANEDSRVMLIEGVKEVPKVFTVTEGMYLDINRMWGLPQELPIGLVTDSKLKTTLTLSGFLALKGDYDEFYFKDTKENVLTRITGDSFTYSFENTEGDQLGRFSLISLASPTGLEEISGSSIAVYLSQGVIYVHSMDGSEIKNVSVVRTNGETIWQQYNTGKSQLEIPVAHYNQEVLLVKVYTERESTTAKLLNK
ncbi:hypothetical protein LJC54_06840 [Parabacteroides sp. OttesenSCG-928-J18]|nr:hypothetical protein [Parabacteroides sp. OttesenSCG-928-J18]